MAKLPDKEKARVFTDSELVMVRGLHSQMQQIKGKNKQAAFLVSLPDDQRELVVRWICLGILGRIPNSS